MDDRLAELLVGEGALSAEAVERALARQREAGGSLDTALLELDLLDEERLADLLSRADGLPPAPPLAWSGADPRARRVFPAKVAERHGLAPFALDGRELSLVASHPVDLALLDEVSFMLSLHLRPHVAPEWRVRELIHRLYGAPLPARLARLAARAPPAPREPEAAEPSAPPPEPEAAEPPPPPPEPSPPLAPRGFGDGAGEPAEPLVAALALAVEAADLDRLLAEPPAAPPPAGPERSAPPRWSLSEASEALGAARTRDEAVLAVLRYARDFFEYVALLAVTRDAVVGHDALAATDPSARERCRRVSFAAGEPGIFRTVVETAGPYLGPEPRDPASDAVLAALGREGPHTILLYPVVLRERPVCVLYADNGEAPVSPRRLGDLLLLAGSLGRAFERIIRERKAQGGPPAPGAAGEAWTVREPGRAGAAPAAGVDVDVGDFQVTVASEALAAPAAFDAVEAVERLARSPRGSSERGGLIARLVEHGAEAAPLLAARFPGPIEVQSPSLAEVTPVDEQGPILTAVAALGTAATPHLLPAVSDPDPDRRRYAVLALGHTGDPAAWPAIAERIFDPDPRVAGAARGALAAARGRPAVAPLLERLRRALSQSPGRAVAAARALGQLKDAEAIPQLVQLLDRSPLEAAAAAADALEQIALRRLGGDAARWLAWWTENRGAPRWRWLCAALSDEDRDLRLAASEELRRAVPPPVPYLPDAPAAERAEAARAWAAACAAAAPEI